MERRAIQIGEEDKMKGVVKFYNEKKGFGFINTEENKDLFFHVTDVTNQEVLKEKDRVKFDVVTGDRGLKAIKIIRI
jgi:CspA family cold shock protein